MSVIGFGIDLVETARVGRLLTERGERFERRCFTERERALAAHHPTRRAEHLAGRFAVKEAVLKALGTGLAQGMRWQDVEVQRQASGQPTVILHGQCAQRAQAMGIVGWVITISHVRGQAIAGAIAQANSNNSQHVSEQGGPGSLSGQSE